MSAPSKMATSFDLLNVFVLLFATTAVVQGEKYNVIIATVPTSGPFLVNREIAFSCFVHPTPREPVTYSWHAVKNSYGATTFGSNASTTRYTPRYRDLHISWFFCKVYSGGAEVGVGRKRIESHGFIFSEQPPVRYFNVGDMVTLQINISNDSLASYIRQLTWYHNGTEVNNSSRVTVQNNGEELVVQNALSGDAGTYRVEVTSLNFYYYYCCDSTWLYFLRNYVAYGPVTFTVKELGSVNGNCDVFEEPPSVQHYPLISGDSSALLSIDDNETLTNDGILHYVLRYVLTRYSAATLSVNGTTLTSNPRKFNLSYTKSSNSLLKEINYQYNTSDEGFYIYRFYSHYYFIRESLLYYYGCSCYDYSSHVPDLNIDYVSFPILHFILRTYKPPFVNISSYHDPETDVELLDCFAYGGVPDTHNITLTQPGKQEVIVSGNNLQIPINRFGEYTCTVESLYNTTTVMLSIQEKASFQLYMQPENSLVVTQCQEWKKRENISNFLAEEITNMFKAFCSCAVRLYDISANCSTTGNLLVRGVITGGEGNISANILVDKLQTRLLTSTEEITMTLGQELFKLDPRCPPRVNSALPDLCVKLPTQSTADMEENELLIVETGMRTSGAIISGSLIGGMIVGFLGCVIILCIGICILKLKNDMNMRQAGSTNANTVATKEQDSEVVMGSNTAYETIEMRYQPRQRSQPRVPPREQYLREEPVYECPAS